MNKELLKARKTIKSKKPKFVRTDIHKNIGLEAKWRKPSGWQNKVRLQKRGKLRRVEVGWGSPKEVKGLSREGLSFVNVCTVEMLKTILPKEQIVVVSSTIGNRKRLLILEEAKKLGLKVFNFLNVDKKIDSINKTLEESKKNSEIAKKRVEERLKKSASKPDKSKKGKEDKKDDKVDSTEDDKTAKKKEYDKNLIRND
ncbi:MAG: eL32 family ribosomal protein [Candidatus Woesearchaeota archaeon]|jgi:large subunit ribosomal protein L32e